MTARNGITRCSTWAATVTTRSSDAPVCCRRSSVSACSSSRVDTVNLDDRELSWIDRELSRSRADWKIVYQHHPLYSSGRYWSSAAVRRRTLEQAMIEHEVDVVFAGHEHLYERIAPQSGVVYFVAGATGSVRQGDLRPSRYQAKGYDRDLSFMLIEVAGSTMYFQAINRLGETIDNGANCQEKASVVVGQDGRSTICRTLSSKAATHAGTSSSPAAVKSVSICVRGSCFSRSPNRRRPSSEIFTSSNVPPL